MSNTNNRAESLLTELYNAGVPFLNEYPWEFEGDRWAELLVCGLIVELRVDTQVARESIDTLKRIGMTSIEGLASASPEQRIFIERVLVQHGYEAADAAKASNMLISLAQAVQKKWDGYLQRFLRTHGEKMAEELGGVLNSTGIENQAASKIAVLWLQSVANIPILLPRDPYIQTFCREHALSEQQLLEAADRLGLNVGVLDDLLALEALAASQAPKLRPSQGQRTQMNTSFLQTQVFLGRKGLKTIQSPVVNWKASSWNKGGWMMPSPPTKRHCWTNA